MGGGHAGVGKGTCRRSRLGEEFLGNLAKKGIENGTKTKEIGAWCGEMEKGNERGKGDELGGGGIEEEKKRGGKGGWHAVG